ncbi:hypothetical protein ABY44_20425 [Burkholderia sp. ZZQ-2]|nr:hypothetical protein WL00_17900 [Burkholderia cepacia]KVX64317.1 hypothetical protein WL07_30595 [Burkholderia cepacia]
MSEVTQEPWKGHAIDLRAIPVRRIVTRLSALEGYIAIVRIVRIERNDEVSDDRHPPRFSERWTSATEARRDAVEYAVKSD